MNRKVEVKGKVREVQIAYSGSVNIKGEIISKNPLIVKGPCTVVIEKEGKLSLIHI